MPSAVAVAQSAGAGSAALEFPAVAAAPFDDSAVAESKETIPPFPYIAYPPKLGQAFQNTNVLPMDEVYVLVGGTVYRLEGQIETRDFDQRDAQMTALEVRRTYESAVQAFGAVKVASGLPDYPAAFRKAGLRMPQPNMSYDVYLARQGSARHWIIVMTNDNSTRLLTIEASPFVQTLGYEGTADQAVAATGSPPAAPQPLDIASLPVHAAPLPPFPYLAYPATVGKAFYRGHHAASESVSFIAGTQLRTVEGALEERGFYNSDARLSQMAARRNYAAALLGLGAVKVSAIPPTDPALIAASTSEQDLRQKKLRIPEQNMSYDSYLVRTPEKNIWVALMFSDSRTSFVVVEESASPQVKP